MDAHMSSQLKLRSSPCVAFNEGLHVGYDYQKKEEECDSGHKRELYGQSKRLCTTFIQ